MIRSVVKAIGSYTPERVVTNDDLSKRLDTSDTWIRERTGIAQRHIAADGEYTSHLGAHAAKRALDNAGMHANDIDLIVLATATPDNTFPATATQVQHMIGNEKAAALDVNAACSGFVYGMHVADALLKSGAYKHALVIGSETMSRVVDWDDRRTAILFGDGAGACILSAQESTERGVLGSLIASDGQYTDLLRTHGGVSSTREAGVLHMEGKEVFRHAVEKMTQAVETTAKQAGVRVEDIDYLVPHQANARILAACAKRLHLPSERIVMTVQHHANTSSASIPLALAHTQRNQPIAEGALVMLTALGAGFTWGSCLIRW